MAQRWIEVVQERHGIGLPDFWRSESSLAKPPLGTFVVITAEVLWCKISSERTGSRASNDRTMRKLLVSNADDPAGRLAKSSRASILVAIENRPEDVGKSDIVKDRLELIQVHGCLARLLLRQSAVVRSVR